MITAINMINAQICMASIIDTFIILIAEPLHTELNMLNTSLLTILHQLPIIKFMIVRGRVRMAQLTINNKIICLRNRKQRGVLSPQCQSYDKSQSRGSYLRLSGKYYLWMGSRQHLQRQTLSRGEIFLPSLCDRPCFSANYRSGGYAVGS